MQIQPLNGSPKLTVMAAIGKPGLRIRSSYPRPENALVFSRIGHTHASHNSGLVNPTKCQSIPDITPDCQLCDFRSTNGER